MITLSVMVFSGSSSVNGNSDGINNVRKSQVKATSNLFNKFRIYLANWEETKSRLISDLKMEDSKTLANSLSISSGLPR